MKKWSFVFSAFVITIAITSYAAKFPRGCQAVGYEFHNGELILTPVRGEPGPLQTLYFMHNKSFSRVQLTAKKMLGQTFSPAYPNVIDPDQWGAFAIDQEQLDFVCSNEYRRGRLEDCERLLEICQYPRAKFAEHNMGTYWVSNSETLTDSVEQVTTDFGVWLRE
jgi:hypothetical protein